MTAMAVCSHLDDAPADFPAQTPDRVCQGCHSLDEDWAVHLRICLQCGYVGCCDSSPRRHATAHSSETGHPVMRSFEPGETWRWCYVDEMIG
jgi:uncharacterized UBP type Zn finger protein